MTRNVLIAGAGPGVSGSLARLYAAEGAQVGLLGVEEDVLARLADDVRSAGGSAATVVVDLTDERPTAIGSANYHEAHFGTSFGLRTPDGAYAHSACVGFGLERITLALFTVHGPDVGRWPASLRGRLGC